MHETREEAQVFSTLMIKDKYSHGYSENIFCFLGKCLKCIASITTIPTGIVNMEFNTSVFRKVLVSIMADISQKYQKNYRFTR